MELKLKYLAGYLPYKLKILTNSVIREMVCELSSIETGSKRTSITNVINGIGHKPILHPLSDIAKYCKDLGFVPIRKFYDMRHVSDFELIAWEKELIKDIKNDKEFKLSDFKKLYEWHFDIYGLIEKDLAISIHDVAQADA